ncbi:hypothetical protein EBR04_00235 [bacterium]|nr:hypothetical protein [bacterium]
MHIGLRPDDLTACHATVDGDRFAPRPRLFGIGMGETGTNVLASLFKGVPAAHEPALERFFPGIRTPEDVGLGCDTATEQP